MCGSSSVLSTLATDGCEGPGTASLELVAVFSRSASAFRSASFLFLLSFLLSLGVESSLGALIATVLVSSELPCSYPRNE